jgi:hypothetical protein
MCELNFGGRVMGDCISLILSEPGAGQVADALRKVLRLALQ